MSTPRTRKFVVCLGLILYSAAIFCLALHPHPHVTLLRDVILALAVVSIVGLVAYASPGITLPYENYAYLIVGWNGFTTLLLYLIATHDGAERRLVLSLFLLSGIVGGYGAWLTEERT